MWFQADVITIGPKGLVNASMENITILFLHILNMQSSETTFSFINFITPTFQLLIIVQPMVSYQEAQEHRHPQLLQEEDPMEEQEVRPQYH